MCKIHASMLKTILSDGLKIDEQTILSDGLSWFIHYLTGKDRLELARVPGHLMIAWLKGA